MDPRAGASKDDAFETDRASAPDASEHVLPEKVRPQPGLVVFAVFLGAAMAGGVLLAFLPWRSASTSGEARRSGSTPVGTVSVVSLRVGQNTDKAGNVVDSDGVIDPAARQVQVEVELHGVEEAVPVTAHLVQERTRAEMDLAPVLVDRDRRMIFTFTRRADRWVPGRWRVTVFVSAREAAFTEFDAR